MRIKIYYFADCNLDQMSKYKTVAAAPYCEKPYRLCSSYLRVTSGRKVDHADQTIELEESP